MTGAITRVGLGGPIAVMTAAVTALGPTWLEVVAERLSAQAGVQGEMLGVVTVDGETLVTGD